jgi:hypothetical protein
MLSVTTWAGHLLLVVNNLFTKQIKETSDNEVFETAVIGVVMSSRQEVRKFISQGLDANISQCRIST